jgi:hypothetical protein
VVVETRENINCCRTKGRDGCVMVMFTVQGLFFVVASHDVRFISSTRTTTTCSGVVLCRSGTIELR